MVVPWTRAIMGIVDEAAKQGELVYAFNQGKSEVLTQPGPWGDAYSGDCAGLAMRWLKLRSQGLDYATTIPRPWPIRRS